MAWIVAGHAGQRLADGWVHHPDGAAPLGTYSVLLAQAAQPIIRHRWFSIIII
jgi:hypothetical protein